MNYIPRLCSMGILMAGISGCLSSSKPLSVSSAHNDIKEDLSRETIDYVLKVSVKVQGSAILKPLDTDAELKVTHGVGSGLALSNNYVLTVAHNLPTPVGIYDKIEVVQNEIIVEGYKAKAVKRDHAKDLALLILEDCPKYDCLTPYTGKITSKAEVGDTVIGAGYPFGKDELFFEGHLAGEWNGQDARLTVIDASITLGNSGGPVFVLQHGKPVITGLVRTIGLVGYKQSMLTTGTAGITPRQDLIEFLKDIKGLESYLPHATTAKRSVNSEVY